MTKTTPVRVRSGWGCLFKTEVKYHHLFIYIGILPPTAMLGRPQLPDFLQFTGHIYPIYTTLQCGVMWKIRQYCRTLHSNPLQNTFTEGSMWPVNCRRKSSCQTNALGGALPVKFDYWRRIFAYYIYFCRTHKQYWQANERI